MQKSKQKYQYQYILYYIYIYIIIYIYINYYTLYYHYILFAQVDPRRGPCGGSLADSDPHRLQPLWRLAPVQQPRPQPYPSAAGGGAALVDCEAPRAQGVYWFVAAVLKHGYAFVDLLAG